jgi:hypothetical protein
MIKIETFTINDIIVDNQISNEDYKSCLNENSQIYYKSNGKYPNCYAALNQLTDWAGNPGDNLGFGKLKDICPISCLEKTPSDCLQKRITDQERVINDLSKVISNSSSFEPIYRSKINSNLRDQSLYTESLFKDQEVIDALNYMYVNGYPVSDRTYNNILYKLKKTSNQEQPRPTATLINATQPTPNFRNNSNMSLTSENNRSNILGY